MALTSLGSPLEIFEGIAPFGILNTIDDNPYYSVVFDAVENWWRIVPKALADTLVISYAFTLERPARSVDFTVTNAATGVDIWINNNNPNSPPGATGKYNAAQENRLGGHIAVHDTEVYWSEYNLPAYQNDFYMFLYGKRI